MIARRIGAVALAAVLAATVLTGCTEKADTAAAPGYSTSDSVYKEWKPAERKGTVSFESTSDTGEKITSKQYLGKVWVVNFWYSGCPPCIKEAPTLEGIYTSYAGKVPFLGVNTYNQAATSRAFARTRGITYPSVIDANDTAVRLAFAGVVPPRAVPTTLVLDARGRVAARITGLLEDKTILTAMIDRVLAEGK